MPDRPCAVDSARRAAPARISRAPSAGIATVAPGIADSTPDRADARIAARTATA
ncbi:MAG TPA: hypothetical protein VLX44_17870 [Xanthobacteraceae bacterium]|nr:hypothetical protein [Xanthobacteraceae bacterium]